MWPPNTGDSGPSAVLQGRLLEKESGDICKKQIYFQSIQYIMAKWGCLGYSCGDGKYNHEYFTKKTWCFISAEYVENGNDF